MHIYKKIIINKFLEYEILKIITINKGKKNSKNIPLKNN